MVVQRSSDGEVVEPGGKKRKVVPNTQLVPVLPNAISPLGPLTDTAEEKHERMVFEALKLVLSVFSMRIGDINIALEPKVWGLISRLNQKCNALVSIWQVKHQPRHTDFMTSIREMTLEDHYPVISAITTQIINNFPPDTYAYVGLGRSPLPVLAELLRMNASCVCIQLPLSVPRGDNFDGNLNTSSHVRQHLEQFVGVAKLRGRRNVLFMDYVEGGTSLRYIRNILVDFYATQPQSIQVIMFGLASKTNQKASYTLKNLTQGLSTQEALALAFASVAKDLEEVYDHLMTALHNKEFSHASLDLIPSFPWNDLIQGKPCPLPTNGIYALFRLLKRARDASQ